MSEQVSLWGKIRNRIAKPIVSPATRTFFEMGRQAGRPWRQLIHGYVYGRWPYGYIGSAIAERPRLRWLRILFAPFLVRALQPQKWADEYHGKVLPTAQAVRLVSIQQDIEIPQPQEAIPFASARDLILRNPQTIAVLDCPCRMARENPCLPLDVCLIVGDPFASFILEHHPEHARAVDQRGGGSDPGGRGRARPCASRLFQARDAGPFYAICNCCDCCCGAMQCPALGHADAD